MQTTVPVSVAPMMDWTDRHCRYFLRLISPSVRLYTEMVTAAAIHHGDADSLLRFDEAEHPLALQLGGSDPRMMAAAAKLAGEKGYDEVNINVGCPSDRVQSGRFGACLMAEPDVVADCFRAMRDSCDLPITVKSRIGIDDQNSEEFLHRFVGVLTEAGCRHFIVHARIAILEGLSPKENRTVPPLNYERVYALKRKWPDHRIEINGGFTTLDAISDALDRVDGVMIGRQAYHDPWFLAAVEERCLSGRAAPDRRSVVEAMLPYVERQLDRGERMNRITRHMLGLFAGQPGARAWRRHLSEHAHRPDAGPELLLAALDAMQAAA